MNFLFYKPKSQTLEEYGKCKEKRNNFYLYFFADQWTLYISCFCQLFSFHNIDQFLHFRPRADPKTVGRRKFNASRRRWQVIVMVIFYKSKKSEEISKAKEDDRNEKLGEICISPPTTLHNIIKKKEPKMGVCDFQPLRWYCIIDHLWSSDADINAPSFAATSPKAWLCDGMRLLQCLWQR